MIVNSLRDGWEIIYQRSHALLAAQLAAAWCEDYHPYRWTETLIAIAQHDDQEKLWNTTHHLSEIGTPIDFTQTDVDTKRIRARWTIEHARRQGLWIALLISRHNSFLYEPVRGQDQNMDAFLDEQKHNQKNWADLIGISLSELEQHYRLMNWADQLSLILCKHQLPDRERAVEIGEAPDGEIHRVKQNPDGTICLDPYRFKVDKMTFSIEARRLYKAKFNSEEEFFHALETAKIETIHWTFVR